MTDVMEQRSPEWFAARCGKVTASKVADIIAKTKSGPSASRANYAAQLIAERLTGTVEPSFQNDAMRWGCEKESEARDAYAFRFDCAVEEVAMVDHPTIPMSAASPDGLVGDDGLVEFKCPNTATHLDTLQSEVVPGKYITQMQWQMACTGRQWCDFASYDPRLPESMRLFVKRIPRDEAMITELEAEVSVFLNEVESRVADLTARYGETK
jgi:putative phage-type endonuclease